MIGPTLGGVLTEHLRFPWASSVNEPQIMGWFNKETVITIVIMQIGCIAIKTIISSALFL